MACVDVGVGRYGVQSICRMQYRYIIRGNHNQDLRLEPQTTKFYDMISFYNTLQSMVNVRKANNCTMLPLQYA